MTLVGDTGDETREESDAPTTASGLASPAPRSRRWAVALLAVVLALAGGLIYVLLTRENDVLGPDDGTAAQVRAALEPEMTCTAGRLTEERSLLACYHQDDHEVQLVFVQADPDGAVASYTAETILLSGSDPHDHSGETDPHNVELANEIAAVVTPDQSFDACAHDLSTPYYCFGSLATWESDTVHPVTSTGTGEKVPTATEIGDALATELGWECDYGLCSYDGGSATVQVIVGSTGIEYAGPVQPEDAAASVRVVVGLIDDAPAVQDWAEEFDGTLDVIVADGHVVGYLPQAGGGGVFVIGEVAGVLPGEA